jgi:hypothetical protein
LNDRIKGLVRTALVPARVLATQTLSVQYPLPFNRQKGETILFKLRVTELRSPMFAGARTMPQDDLRIDTESNRQPRAGARQEQMRGENTAAAEAMSTRMAEISADRFNGGVRMQTEMAQMLQTIGREWMERRTVEAEFALSLPNRLASVRTYADAVAVISSGSADGSPCARRTASGSCLTASGS